MPFTLAHPAAILPFIKNKRFSITALVAGSMAPDFEFFLQLREVKNIGHHWYGILLFDFPLALAFCYLFHNLLKDALVANLPSYFKNRIAALTDFDWNTYALTNKWNVTASLFIGTVSHILWDGLSHYDGLFVEMFPVLSSEADIAGYNLPVYFLLQLLFSVWGLLAVLSVMLRMPRQQNKMNEEKNKWYWPLFGLCFSLVLCIRLAGWPEYNTFWGVFMAVMGSICYTWLFISFLFKNYLLKKNRYESRY